MRCALAIRFALALAAPCIFAPRHAAAQTAERAGIAPAEINLAPLEREIAVILAALSLIPAGVGVDAAVGPRAVNPIRLTIDWPFQLPLRVRGRRHFNAPFAVHRIVLTPGIAIALATNTVITARLRVGYRAVHHRPHSAIGVLIGLGNTIEVWPEQRASISPEIGLHIGPCCELSFADVVVIVRADAWLNGSEAARLSAQLGWSFY